MRSIVGVIKLMIEKYYVYILKSVQTGRFYIGSGQDVNDRLDHHNRGSVFSTKRFRPYIIAFQQEFASKTAARKVELRLKRLKRKDYIEKIIQEKRIRLAENILK